MVVRSNSILKKLDLSFLQASGLVDKKKCSFLISLVKKSFSSSLENEMSALSCFQFF